VLPRPSSSSSPENLVHVPTEEISAIHIELLEAVEFAKLTREGGDKLLILFWRNA
jgi:hypothetical protein